MPSRVRIAVIVAIVVAALSGCLQFETVITIRPDGTGELEQTFLMNNGVLAMLQGMSAEAGSDEEFSLLDEDELRVEALSMGEGVHFVSAEPIETEWGQGYVALFAFDDINALRVNQNPGENVPDGATAGDGPMEENLTFELTRGTPATLVVRFPSQEVDAGEPESTEDTSMEGMDEMMRQFYADMRIMIAIDVDGTIVSTNATYQDGNRVTLIDLDFNAILDDPEATERLLRNQAESVADIQELAATVPGVKIETTDPVRIRFR